MPSESDIVECPADGCDYSGFRSSVLGHYSGKQDEAHRGGYQKAKELVDSTEGTPPEPSQSRERNERGTQASASDPKPAGGDNPVMGNETPPNRQKRTKNSHDEPTCPRCGGEVVDFTQFTTGEYHEVNGNNVYVRGDYVCSDCHRWFIDE